MSLVNNRVSDELSRDSLSDNGSNAASSYKKYDNADTIAKLKESTLVDPKIEISNEPSVAEKISQSMKES